MKEPSTRSTLGVLPPTSAGAVIQPNSARASKALQDLRRVSFVKQYLACRSPSERTAPGKTCKTTTDDNVSHNICICLDTNTASLSFGLAFDSRMPSSNLNLPPGTESSLQGPNCRWVEARATFQSGETFGDIAGIRAETDPKASVLDLRFAP